MKRLLLTYGIIAGFVIVVTMTISIEMGHGSIWLGYLIMLIAFSTIFVAIKQHREDTLGGVISFGIAFVVGISITAVASVVYVAVWELYLAVTDYKFIDDYVTSMSEAQKREGISEAEIAAAISKADEFKAQYLNPVFRIPITFLEVFPVGLLVSLISAAVLRNHRSA